MPIRFLSSLICLLLFQWGYGQDNGLKMEPAQVEKTVIVDQLDYGYEDISRIQLTNTTHRTIELRYQKIIDVAPRKWSTVLFRRARYTNGTGSSSEDRATFSLKAGETVEFQLIIQPNGESGESQIRVPFVNARQPGRPLATATFRVTIEPTGNASSPVAEVIRPSTRVYPNPADDHFFVEIPSNQSFGRVELYNSLGSRLRSYNEPAGRDGYNIEDLPEGLYLVNIYNRQGEKIKTLRLLHRRGGA